MKTASLILTFLIVLFLSPMHSQDLKKHQWKERVLLILTDNTNSQEFQTQIKALQNEKSNLIDRKLVIYQITPTHFKLGLFEENEWIKRFIDDQDIKLKSKPIEVILIGLDGAEKLRQHSFLTSNKLFVLIDSMPMRRAEIRRND